MQQQQQQQPRLLFSERLFGNPKPIFWMTAFFEIDFSRKGKPQVAPYNSSSFLPVEWPPQELLVVE
jgi:hypothetical protein